MRRVAQIGALLALTAAPSLAQVTIQNEKHLAVPEQKVQLLLEIACQSVAEEFHVDVSAARFPLTLVIGAENERYSTDRLAGTTTVYMREWNEVKFTATVMTLAIQNVSLNTNHYKYLLVRILRRADKATSVSVSKLRKKK